MVDHLLQLGGFHMDLIEATPVIQLQVYDSLFNFIMIVAPYYTFLCKEVIVKIPICRN